AGRSPTQGDDLEALASAATNATRRPTPLSLGVPVSPEVEAVFARALAVTPRQRYHRAGQFWLELEAASGLPMTFATRERAARVGFAPTPIAARPIAPGSTPPYALSSAPSHATRGPDGRIYPWGDEPPSAQHLNACGSECSAWGKQQHTELTALYPEDDGYVATAPVGSFAKGRSRFGPYDVVGNVWEWTSTWYGPYSLEKSRNPQGPERGERRVIRGGAFNGGYESWLHPSFRYGQVPVAQSHGIGFRCAATIATAKH
ncbi:MAG TPA: SUMF1/EgtB/PvdO family nonheme iron enzyme, partial [Polyangiaceae bacterium]